MNPSTEAGPSIEQITVSCYTVPIETPESVDAGGRRPVDPKTGEPLAPLAQPGYYPGYSTLSQQKFWDAATREKVLKRVNRCRQSAFLIRRRHA
jgi:hypothetical protein